MKFSELYHLEKSQAELDFVDIFIDKDTYLFIDPWAIRQRSDNFSVECYQLISNFFELLIKNIKEEKKEDAMRMLDCLHEPKETHLGMSKTGTSGLAIGGGHAREIYEKLNESMAVKTGFLNDLEDCALMIDGIDRDKISDIVTNLTRFPLLKYTEIQCKLHNIPTRELPSGYFWDAGKKDWLTTQSKFPNFKKKIILVPKFIVRRTLSLNSQEYYNFDILEFEQARHLEAGTSLCRTLKDGTLREPTKKNLRKIISNKKENIYRFTRDNPTVLENCKKRKSQYFIPIKNEDIKDAQNENIETDTANNLIGKLKSIPTGKATADNYHGLMIGILEKLFYPFLVNPKKEYPRNEGRKRIDISFLNTASNGFFANLPKLDIPCKEIFFECKNYSYDLQNPEFDQLNGRFAQNISQFGFLLCRKIENKKLFLKRCKDFVRDKRHFIIGLDDEDIKILLESSNINSFLEKKLGEIIDQ